jgi:hypothetical protein
MKGIGKAGKKTGKESYIIIIGNSNTKAIGSMDFKTD